jgi:glycosyltransferase involved in cell wall biosynthesis
VAHLQGETIIYFGPEPWDGLWRNRHQLMSRFAEHNNVWYVEPPAMLRDLFGMQRKGVSSPPPLHSRLVSRDPSGVNIFHGPWWLPITGRAPFKSISNRLFLSVLARTARSGSGRRPIVWLSRPAMVDYLEHLDAELTVYHVVDEYSGYGQPSISEIKFDSKEIELLRKSDTVIVVTPTLFDAKSPYNLNTHVVANAVDFDAYSQPGLKTPEDMRALEGPVIGYSGLIAARLDLQLLQEAATQRPHWNFVFVGTVNSENCEPALQALSAMPNVYLLGNKPVHEVPHYVQRFDVCVIPYVLNLRAQHSSPLKLYEYAAASKPIVASDFTAARTFDGHVRIAGDTEEFISACEAALLLERSGIEITENRRIAANNTWDHRVEQISGILGNMVA